MSETYSSDDFRTVVYDDFNGSSLNRSVWKAVYSADYHDGMFSWTPGQVRLGDGTLTLRTEDTGDGWVSGGISTIPDGLTYGRYEFRAMIEAGQGTTGVILLWPSSNRWTDEVDIVETHRGDRSQFAFVNHGTPWETDYINVDVSDWHAYTLDWLPGLLRLSVDGRVVSEMTNDVPSQKMSFGVQGGVTADWETWYGGGPDSSTPDEVDLKMDWVRISEWTPGEGDGGGGGSDDDGGDPPPAEEPSSGGGGGGGSSWDDHADADGTIDWEALAAQVLANYEATGQWFV